MRKIQKILIANRGEIALRVIRSAREMGIRTVAVYSEADRQALHVQMADEAYFIGPSAASQSYLRIEKLIETALLAGADAIHPGYGFLSENAEFAKQVNRAGLIFIGPTSEAIALMGSKLAAKEAAQRYGVPLVPGTASPISDIQEAKQIASRIGFPILVKASAGGGGKGMRVVRAESEMEEQIARAMSEATSAFGDGSVFIEKFVTSPRHIEFQVLGDQHGNIVHLFERECSVQRRHQKVVEEAPSSVLTPELRARMGECAVNVAKACQYQGAGTVEFILDDQLNFYFLEMNTRLQVEHPVTECITGLDLVKEQIRVASGEPLGYTQADLQMRGHAIEVRVYAEDPQNGFLPDIGKLMQYQRPNGIGVRVDDGYEKGMEIPIFYDPLIAKLIAFGSNRAEAIERMKRAIDEYVVAGVKTTLPFCRFVMEHEAFRSGQFDTHFVEKYFTAEAVETHPSEEEKTLAAGLLQHLLSHHHPSAKPNTQTADSSNWKRRAWK